MSKSIRDKGYFFVLLSTLLLVYAYSTYSLRNWFIDDSYITLTYSKHFALNGKPWYNLDPEFQGNGQTSILWMFFQAIPIYFRLPVKPEIINLIINLILGVYLIYKFSKLFNTENVYSMYNLLLFCLSLLFSYWLGFNSKHGLETVLYTFSLFQLLINWNNKKSLFYSYLLCFIRPDALIILLFYVLDTKLLSRFFYQKLLTIFCSLVSILLYLSYFYNYIIPLPFILKTINEFNAQKISKFIIFIFLFSPIIIYVILNIKKRFLFYAPLFILIGYYSFFVDEVMNVADRYVFPLFIYYYFYFKDLKFVLPVIFKIKIFNYLFVILSITYSFKYFKLLQEYKYFYKSYYIPLMNDGPIYIGKYFSKLGNIKLATSDAGAIAYYSNGNCYDTWGLNDATLLITKKKKDWSGYINYLKSKGLDYIILISKDKNEYVPRIDFENRIYKSFELSKSPIVLKVGTDDYYYFCYKVK